MKPSLLVEQFRRVVARQPERPAIIAGEQAITYGELEAQTAAAAQAINERVKGDLVAVLLPNSAVFAPVILGAMWAGKTVAVLPTLAPPQLLKLMVGSARAETVITSEEFIPRLIEAGIPAWLYENGAKIDPNTVPLRERTRETSVFLYTSGTTGMPKTVELSEANLAANIEGCRMATGFDGEQVLLPMLPLFHAYGLTVTLLLPLTTGATIILPKGFQPKAILQLIEKYKVTCLVAVPSQYRVLAMEPTEVDTSSLWLCIAGAERLPEQTAMEFERRFRRPVVQGYGATELSPVVSINMPSTNRFGSVGRPLPNILVTIRDENERVLGPGERGDVCVEGPSVMMGYYGDPASTGKKIRNGVLYTGDKGYLDEDGYLHLVGRADDLVKIAGEKVYPAEVETIIENIEGVEEAAVLAFPDESHGVRLHAFVMLKPGSTHTENTLRSTCREVLEPYKVPRGFSVVDTLPRTVTGKTDKRALAAVAV